jgi:hypothetical protein
MQANLSGGASFEACVAIVDAEDVVGEALRTALETAGFQAELVRLADYATGQAALAALVARGVDVIVYELDKRHQLHPTRFQDFYTAIGEERMPLLITTAARWLQDEQGADLRHGSEAGNDSIERIVRAIRREIERHRQDA